MSQFVDALQAASANAVQALPGTIDCPYRLFFAGFHALACQAPMGHAAQASQLPVSDRTRWFCMHLQAPHGNAEQASQ